jgi:hypothetical protein
MRSLIAAALLAIAGTPAVACSIVPTTLTWDEQIQQAEQIFIGTVLMIDNKHGAVLFAVDEPIRGIDRMWIEVRQGDGATCDRVFESAGTQWIFAGTFVGGPTREITTPLDAEELAMLATARALARAN